MTPSVSVLMPTFNRMQFLPPAIDSVRAQTFGDWELIIADDGSDAATRSYLETLHQPPKIELLWLRHSGRPAIALNAALRVARGEYVAFLDSDDLWLPQKLERQMASLRLHPHRRWSYTAFTLVEADGTPRMRGPNPIRALESGWILEKMLTEQLIIAQPSVVVARALLEQLGAFDEELTMCYDDELWLRLALHSEIDAVDEPLTLVRRHNQHSSDDVTAWRDRRRVFEGARRHIRDPALCALLHSLRAQMSAGLARSQWLSGTPMAALATTVTSAPYSWRYGRWWQVVLGTAARALTPGVVRSAVRRLRSNAMRA
jgi:glycosyltransferase involved in cell wall biosynthesis